MRLKILFLAVFTSVTQLTLAQAPKPKNSYVVIGAFAKIDNAIRYTDKANKMNFSASYELNSVRKLYYVYLLNTTDRKKAFAYMIKLRVETDYKDCWVFIGTLGEKTVEQEIIKPLVVAKPVEEPPAKKDTASLQLVFKPDSSEVKKPDVKADSAEIKKPEVKKPPGKPFFFKLVNAESGNEVVGEVHIQESSRATQYQAIRGNEIAYIKAPVNKDGTYSLITQVPGYQQEKLTFAYNDPALTKGPEGEVILPLELKKAKAGNYIDFNHVRFVRNSSVMNPESKDELDGLVALMKENMKYKIKIHGHCNGTQNREMILRGTSSDFFAMDPSHNKKTTTSAKVLTEDRANAVKAYLESQGIDQSRVTIKGEGGKIPLYPEGSTLQEYNDRIEVEIKKN